MTLEIQDRIRQGGMGELHSALICDKEVLVKKIRPELNSLRSFIRCFKREIKKSTELGRRFPWRFPEIFENHTTANQLCMERIEGQDLRASMHGEIKLSQRTILYIIIQICEAIELMRCTNGTIHRDLKPDNIMVLTNGKIKVIDLGLVCDNDTRAEDVNLEIGSPLYRPPEGHGKGFLHDTRFDLYSLGKLIIELNNLTKPQLTGTEIENPTTSKLIQNLPSDICEIVIKLLQKNRDNRYPTANEAGRAIAEVALKRFGPEIAQEYPYCLFLGRKTAQTPGPTTHKIRHITIPPKHTSKTEVIA